MWAANRRRQEDREGGKDWDTGSGGRPRRDGGMEEAWRERGGAARRRRRGGGGGGAEVS